MVRAWSEGMDGSGQIRVMFWQQSRCPSYWKRCGEFGKGKEAGLA